MLVDVICPRCGRIIKIKHDRNVDWRPIVIEHGLDSHLLFIFLNGKGEVLRVDLLDSVIKIPTEISIRDLAKLIKHDELARAIFNEIFGLYNGYRNYCRHIIKEYLRKLRIKRIKINDSKVDLKKTLKRIKKLIAKALKSRNPDEIFEKELKKFIRNQDGSLRE